MSTNNTANPSDMDAMQGAIYQRMLEKGVAIEGDDGQPRYADLTAAMHGRIEAWIAAHKSAGADKSVVEQLLENAAKNAKPMPAVSEEDDAATK